MSAIVDVLAIGDNLYIVTQKIWPNNSGKGYDDGFLLKYTMSGKQVRDLCRLYQEQQPETTAEVMTLFADIDYDEDEEAEFRLEEIDATGLDFDSTDDEEQEDSNDE